LNSKEIINGPVLVLVGPTAIGKTDLSLSLAEHFSCEIISVDSMQVYRFMDVGTAKATKEERQRVQHHLIDIVNPDENYDAARFVEDARAAIIDIHNRSKIPLLTGGTGLYLKALFEGIFSGVDADPQIRRILKKRLLTEGSNILHQELCACDHISAKRIHLNDKHRLLRALEVFMSTGKPWSAHLREHKEQNEGVRFPKALLLGLTCDRSELYDRINTRCKEMIYNGLEEEVRSLLQQGYNKKLKAFRSIGYKHMIQYIDGESDQTEMLTLLSRDTRRYAKRQYTWFSRLEKLQWLDVAQKQEIFQKIDKWKKEML